MRGLGSHMHLPQNFGDHIVEHHEECEAQVHQHEGVVVPERSEVGHLRGSQVYA